MKFERGGLIIGLYDKVYKSDCLIRGVQQWGLVRGGLIRGL